MSFLSRLFGSPDTQEVSDNSRNETWVYDSTPDDIAMIVKSVPGMPPFRTCLNIGIGQAPVCAVEAERDRLKAQVDELMRTIDACFELSSKHMSKRDTGRNRNGAEACTHIAEITRFILNKYEENADADNE